jgi:hypothetical protein
MAVEIANSVRQTERRRGLADDPQIGLHTASSIQATSSISGFVPLVHGRRRPPVRETYMGESGSGYERALVRKRRRVS